jgi:TrmH family RNA methyltransferase
VLTQSEIKKIRSLEKKKYRKELNLFVVEGEKMVKELLNSNFKVKTIYATQDYQLPENNKEFEYMTISEKNLERISQLKTPNKVLALAQIPHNSDIIANGLTIALDNIQDPGNMGTIIRTASWFGISSIICSKNTVDIYNSKVIQSTMGGIFKIETTYTDLEEFLIAEQRKGTPVYGTLLDGDNLYSSPLQNNGIIVMGNESKGLSPEIRQLITHPIRIPDYPDGHGAIESLNVGIAAAIVMAEFRRR